MSIEPEVFETPETHQDDEHYKIGGISEADWAVRKLAKYRRKIAERQQLANDEKAKIDGWLEDANKADRESVIYFEAILHIWHEAQLAEDPKAKTIKLPGGQLQARQRPGHFDIDDEQFVPWALEHDLSLVRTKYEPIKSEIKDQTRVAEDGKVANSDGEALPGVTWVEGEVTFKAVTE